MKVSPAIWLSLLLGGHAASCAQPGQCFRHTDCARGEHCELGACVKDSTGNSSPGDAGAGGEFSGSGAAPSADGGKSSGGTQASSSKPGSSGAGGAGGAGGEAADSGAGG
ncbi:MAG TPA: hypothetical protein VFQ61_30280 [Polyangiaceae bacterium]|nr:hypothetical protein [Polyangiaceae bacterium]